MLKRNIVANVLGGSWTALVSVLLIPIQVHFLGVPAYGLLAFVASVQVIFSIFDFGLSPTITREVAQDTSSGFVRTRRLVRSLSLIYWPIGFVLGAALFFSSGWLATHWLNVETLSPDKVSTAIRLAAIAIALRWPVSLYSGVLAGRQRFDALNGIRAAVATINVAGGVVVLMTTGDLIAYMSWTALAAAIEVGAYLAMIVRLVPALLIREYLRLTFDRSVWSFAWGMTLINVLTMVLTQSDRLLISKLLAIEVLGYYALAYNILYGLTLLQNFVTSAMFPAFVSSAAGSAADELRVRYDKATQVLMYAFNLPIWLLAFFGRDVLALITSQPTVDRTAPVLSILAVGFLFNSAASLAYTAAVATGNTSLPIRNNLIAVAGYVPILVLATLRLGAIGAALAWLLLNVYYLATLVPIVHRDIVRTSTTRWLTKNFLPFVGTGILVFGAGRVLSDLAGGGGLEALVVTVVGVVGYSIVGFTLLSASVRNEAVNSVRQASHFLIADLLIPVSSRGEMRQPTAFAWRRTDKSLPCPYCSAAARFEFHTRDLNLRVSQTNFSYFQCPACRLIFIAEPPADLARYYPSQYYSIPGSRRRLEQLARRETFKLDLIRPYRASGNLLEVGSAWGSFAYAAKLAGYDVTAVEMDKRCCQYLREVVGVDVHAADDTGALPDELGQYEVVALWHVIEHFQHFKEMLIQLAGFVRPGGIIAIASPNPGAWQFGLMREHWPHVDAPRHLQLVPAQVVIEVLSARDFEVVLSTGNDPGGLRWNRFGWQRLILNALPSSRAAMAVGIAAGAALGEMLSPFDRRRDRGATYTLILRRKPIAAAGRP